MAATTCLYIAIAILVIGTARGWWRWLFLIPAVAMPVLVGLSRLYRGEHHPTDLTGSVIFAALWLTAATLALKPGTGSGPAGKVERSGNAPRIGRVAGRPAAAGRPGSAR
jgi:undecaprenyl-diphosphatase